MFRFRSLVFGFLFLVFCLLVVGCWFAVFIDVFGGVVDGFAIPRKGFPIGFLFYCLLIISLLDFWLPLITRIFTKG